MPTCEPKRQVTGACTTLLLSGLAGTCLQLCPYPQSYVDFPALFQLPAAKVGLSERYGSLLKFAVSAELT